jgi:hypothetical protein
LSEESFGSAAIDRDGHALDVAGHRRAEERDQRGDVLGLTEATSSADDRYFAVQFVCHNCLIS